LRSSRFRENPEKYPLDTETGKFEIYSRALAEKIKSFGWTQVEPIPVYQPAAEGYEATFEDWATKKKGPYPLQLYTIHYMRRSHTVFDNIPWLREAFPSPLFMNPKDAEERGIRNGDTVLITSRHGKTLRPVQLTERIMPGVVSLPHGAWVEMDEALGIDKAGADNVINGAIPTGKARLGERLHGSGREVAGRALEARAEWPLRIVF